ncbi:universal stress protein [Photobacterium indicum]|jgi:universal stress protein E|uniref:Universal stress protein n=1 Tax=Photobacterium indicum TaxID=81447 RepID=A0A2T3L719_9GAMM|nr:universal stress protein [Photobacterium indicum]PSV46173.1 universal stress protein [Photobacterium indicum]
MNFNQLLIPIAPEQPLGDSFHQALRCANSNASQVTLLMVIEELAELKEIANHSGTTLDLLDKATKVYHAELKQHVINLKTLYSNVKFNTQIRTGIPFIEIIKSAKEFQSKVIIIDSHRSNKERACQSGSTTRHLMRKSEIPIWSISPNSTPIRNVVAAIDFSNQDNEGFTDKIISLAIEFCTLTGADLTLCHAWRLESEGFLRKWSGYTELDIALVAKKMRTDRAMRLKSLLMPYENSLVNTKVRLLEGDARSVLPQFVEKESVDVVILGSLSRSGVAGFLMGNTAESMLNQLNCSVITLKPDAFRSPVLS